MRTPTVPIGGAGSWGMVAKKLRHKIPAEGLQFANHSKLRAYFSGRHLEVLANTDKHMQAKVGKLDGITELVKLNKHSERLAAGKLSAKRHTPSQIEGDIDKERAKLQLELRKLEL